MGWLVLVICAALAGLCRAEIECFTNGISAFLFDHFGQGGVIKCKSATECFESAAESKSSTDLSIKYSSGCTACVKWSFDSECKTCKTPLCNVQLARKITENNLLCYYADDEATMGIKRIWCSKIAKTCYHMEYKNNYKESRYHAGCGPGWSGTIACNTSLCNIPDSLVSKAQSSSGVDFDALSKGGPATGGRKLFVKGGPGPRNAKNGASKDAGRGRNNSSQLNDVINGGQKNGSQKLELYEYDRCAATSASVVTVAIGAVLAVHVTQS